jgi:hypothetical protein
MEPWNDETIKISNNVRINSLNLSEYQRRNYFYYKSISNYFDILIIITSSLVGLFSVGATPYLKQGTISLVSCSASMLITILSSIKLYLNINDNLQSESDMARKFYVLSLEINKIINLPDEKRGINSSDFLNSKYNMYIKLYEESNLLKRRYKKDQLAKMDESLLLSDNNSNSSSSYNETHNNIIVNDNDSS